MSTPNQNAKQTMTALRAHERGGPEKLVVEQCPTPVPGPGEVLVEVHAAGITFAELTWDETWKHLPTIPSHEVSGVVAGLGPDVDLEVGDEVYGLIRFDRNGAAAEYVTVPAADLALRPRSVSHVVSAAVPLAALTAWQALVDQAKVVQGERVLVQGGAGGVGSYVVQLAASLGAEVTATSLAQDVNHVRELGARYVVDVQSPDPQPLSDDYDAVIDTVGGAALEQSYGLLRPGGRLVTLQAPPSVERTEEHGITGLFFVVTPDRSELEQLADLVDSWSLQVAIAGTFALEDGRAAYESGATFDRPPGKTVIVVRD